MSKRVLYISLSILTALFAGVRAYACGAFERYGDTGSQLLKYHFYQEEKTRSYSDSQSEENIALWRALTGRGIPDSMIIEGLYKLPLDSLTTALNTGKTSNTFLKWIYDNKANDLKEFLLTAKELEELRHNRVSAWYYPSDKSGFDKASDEKGKFRRIINKCNSIRSGRLADRYALQAIRAYMSLGEYQNCIDHYRKTLARLPERNLFKRMAKGYIAGCYHRLGDHAKADEMFAELGDFVSVSNEEKLEYMAKVNPECDRFKMELNHYIGYGDSIDNMRYYNIADIALQSPKTIHRGDWLYLKAYIEKIYRSDTKAALRYVGKALANSFSMPQMREDARLFKICLSHFNRNSLSDIKWMLDNHNDGKWLMHIPGLLERNELTKALLIANYDTEPDTLRYNHKGLDWHTWAYSGFQMLLSCKADDVVKYKNELARPSMALTSMLKPGIRHDADYMNDIIGTLYLREGNYRMAERYLRNVSFDYQRHMNIYKGEYLRYNPWDYYYTKADTWYYPWYIYHFEEYESEWIVPQYAKSKVTYLESQKDAKLNFAREMVRLEGIIKNEKDTDKRALARLRFAIGRYNSLNTCWALTQYWLGSSNQCYYCEYLNENGNQVEFIIDTPRELKGLDKWFEREVEDIFKSMKNQEDVAEAHLILRNYRTLAKHFPDTKAGRFIASRCDSWSDWL